MLVRLTLPRLISSLDRLSYQAAKFSLIGLTLCLLNTSYIYAATDFARIVEYRGPIGGSVSGPNSRSPLINIGVIITDLGEGFRSRIHGEITTNYELRVVVTNVSTESVSWRWREGFVRSPGCVGRADVLPSGSPGGRVVQPKAELEPGETFNFVLFVADFGFACGVAFDGSRPEIFLFKLSAKAIESEPKDIAEEISSVSDDPAPLEEVPAVDFDDQQLLAIIERITDISNRLAAGGADLNVLCTSAGELRLAIRDLQNELASSDALAGLLPIFESLEKDSCAEFNSRQREFASTDNQQQNQNNEREMPSSQINPNTPTIQVKPTNVPQAPTSFPNNRAEKGNIDECSLRTSGSNVKNAIDQCRAERATKRNKQENRKILKRKEN